MRRATACCRPAIRICRHFYPRSPCGERRSASRPRRTRPAFLSTLSLRRATAIQGCSRRNRCISIHALLAESDRPGGSDRGSALISIHALLAESDRAAGRRLPDRRHFYPRSPCGERQLDPAPLGNIVAFLSTLSLRRATSSKLMFAQLIQRFLSTLSLRRATHTKAHRAAYAVFLSTLSLRRATGGLIAAFVLL